MSELAAQWRDAWQQLRKNPRLLLLILLAIFGVAEAAARLIDFTSDTSLLKLGFVLRAAAVSVLSFGIALAICILSALAALFVVVRAGSFFAGTASVALGRFTWRAALAWLIVLFVPNLIGAVAGMLLSVSRFSEPGLAARPLLSWILPVLYAIVQAVLASALLSRLPAIALRDPHTGSSRNSRMRRPSLFKSYLLVFGLSTAIQLAFWHLSGPTVSLIGGHRVYAILLATETLWATLLAFMAHARAAARDPSLAMVFD
jgi:hypothetical protein